MALTSAAGALMKQTPLQALLEEINFQRTKEMRQLLKDDGGFVVLQGTTYWTDLFVRHFLFQSEPVHSIDSDDLLFFVRKKHVKSSSRHMPKYETEVEVFRKDSRKLPIGDPEVDWEETVYLNMVIHQFDYTLTLAICTRTSPKELQVLRRHSQRVYASPSRRKMDTKGEGEEITYPHICFMVDNFDEVFSDILVRDGEMVCVELVANDKDGAVQGVIFLGSIRYDALKKVYDARQSSLSSKVAQRMSFGLFSSGAGVQTRCEFVRMKGPQGKGHAEMAVTKPKGSGVETPTSEPGFCATDMWDEWEEENDDYCTYRHQRRLSDPSANLNNFSRYGWRTKNAQDVAGNSAGAKARSENEGLDNLASEVSEIEAGDLRDDQQRPAFSASAAKLHSNSNCETKKLDAQLSNSSQDSGQDSSIGLMEMGEKPPLPSPILAEAVLETTIPDSKHRSASVITTNTSTGCGNCFGGKKCKRWSSANNPETPEMSEVYCPSCEDGANETPACLSKMPDKQAKLKPKTILSVDSELVVTKRGSLRLSEPKKKGANITRSSSLSAADRKTTALGPKRATQLPKPKPVSEKSLRKEKDLDKENDKKSSNQKSSTASNLLAKVSPKRLRNAKSNDDKKEKDKAKSKQTKSNTTTNQVKTNSSSNSNHLTKGNNNNEKAPVAKAEEYEIADDATSLNGSETDANAGGAKAKMAILSESESKLMITVRGREELPLAVVEQQTTPTPPPTAAVAATISPFNQRFEKCLRVPVKSESHPLQLDEAAAGPSAPSSPPADNATNDNNQRPTLAGLLPLSPDLANGNRDPNSNHPEADAEAVDNGHATLPRAKRNGAAPTAAAQQSYYNKVLHLVPKRRTPDGTNIYYWCDLPKKALKELDDGAYNPLWTSRGFTQSFHFWKENRRQQSTPLNAFLTYVTLPWWSIAKDLLDHREAPILTF